MSTIKTLIGKLNSSCYESLERAASIAVARTHFNIELEHWLLAFLEDDQTTLFGVLSDAGCKVDQLIKDINSSLELLKIGNDRSPAISDRVVDVVNEAWLISSLDENEQNINSGAILSAMLQKHTLNQLCLAISAEFKKISQSQNPPDFRQFSKNSSRSSSGTSISANIVSALAKFAPLHPTVPNNSSNRLKNCSKSCLFIYQFRF